MIDNDAMFCFYLIYIDYINVLLVSSSSAKAMTANKQFSQPVR